MKPVNEEDTYWFIRWVFMRRNFKNSQIEIGQLKSEIDHLQYQLDQVSVKIRQPVIIKKKPKKPKFKIDKTLWKKHLD
jgi:hypothetical protein